MTLAPSESAPMPEPLPAPKPAPMPIALLMLCHEPPEALAPVWQWPWLSDPAVRLYVHYDAARSEPEFARLRASVPQGLPVTFLTDRVRGHWGGYGLVEATQRLMACALADPAFQPAYLQLLSGSCMPMRPLAALREFLTRRCGMEFIQSVDVSVEPWVRSGLEAERFRFWHPFDFKRQRPLFEAAVWLQRKLKVWREPPEGLRPRLGSQWFCITRETAAAVLQGLARPDWRRYFERCWIPDEMAIQTLVAQACPSAFIAGHNLTYLEFDEHGQPLVLENGHGDHLRRQPFFFARKIAPEAAALRAELIERQRPHRPDAPGEAPGTRLDPELDLGWFEQAGRPTGHYQRFLARAQLQPQARSHLGTSTDTWRGLMLHAHRPYVVLIGSAPGHVRAVAAAARARLPGWPLFDHVFAPGALDPVADGLPLHGLQPTLRARRDLDPAAFLHELVHLDDAQPTAFALDPAVESWARGFIVWDRQALVIDLDPPGLSPAQRGSAALRGMGSTHRYEPPRQMIAALAARHWMPTEFFAEALREGKLLCTVQPLSATPPEPLATALAPLLQALRDGAAAVDAWAWYPPEAAARAWLDGDESALPPLPHERQGSAR